MTVNNNTANSTAPRLNKHKKDPTKPTILELKNLWMTYPDNKNLDNKKKIVLSGINLRVSAGSFITIVGPTGCGKSTLFRLMLGIEKPTYGEILVNGNRVTSPDRNRGVVFQKYSLFPNLTVVENVSYGLELEQMNLLSFINTISYFKRKKKYLEEAMNYLEIMGLADAANKYPYELSGGMRQRTAIAQTVIMKPKILCMDEPFGALDQTTREVMQAFILDMWSQSDITVFFVTHDIEEAMYLGTRVIVLSQYYSNTDGSPGTGSKIVYDAPIPELSPRQMDVKYSPWFNEMMKDIRSQGLDPSVLQSIKEFELRHRLSVVEDGSAIPPGFVIQPTGPEKKRFDIHTSKD